MGISYWCTLDHNPYVNLGEAWHTLSETLLRFEHGCERIDHRGDQTLENLFKLGIFGTLVDLFDEMIQYTDDEFLLLWSGKVLELVRLQHETTQNGGNILFGKAIIEIFHLDFFHRSDETFGIDFTTGFLEYDVHYNLCIL